LIRQVYVVWSNPLFRDTVQALLSHPEVTMVGSSQSCAPTWSEIERLRPCTIIIEETQENPAVAPEALRILEASPWNLQVIRLSLQDNELWLYQREQQMLEQGDDLLHLILA
jgi:hypothetical protein